ncbi:MAG: hypothetical protein ACRD0U_13720 [Acidimicrobiales bacterium]
MLADLLLLDLHRGWSWFVIVGNGLAGVWALAAHWVPSLRTRALWWFTVLAEVAIFVQVALGVGLVAGEDIEPPQFHMFYGFVAIIAVGILYSYRTTSPWVRQRVYLVYGLGSLFLMGLAIRALLVGTT